MRGRERLAWLAAGLALLSFLGSLELNRRAARDADTNLGRYRAGPKPMKIDCRWQQARARRWLARDRTDQKRAEILVSAHVSEMCLSKGARRRLREKRIAVETSEPGALEPSRELAELIIALLEPE